MLAVERGFELSIACPGGDAGTLASIVPALLSSSYLLVKFFSNR
jgi:hypothetical protein